MTKTRRHHWIFKLWIKVRGLLALLIILFGVGVGLLSLLLPFDGLYKERLVQFLEQQWQMQVTVEDIDGSWQGYGPMFTLRDLSLQAEQSLQLKSAQIQLNLYQWLMPGGERGIDLSINEAELAMIQSGAQVSIKRNGDEQKLTQTLDRLLQAGSLRVQALKLSFLNENDEPLVSDLTADFLLQQGEEQRGLQLLIQEADQQELEIRAVTNRNHQIMKTAEWYVRFNQLSVSFLQPFLTVAKLPEARINGELWVTTQDGVITGAHGQWQWQQNAPDLNFQVAMQYDGDQKTGQNIWQISDVLMNKQAYPDFEFLGQWQGDEVVYQSHELPVPWLSHLIINSVLPALGEDERSALINQSQGQINDLTFRYDYSNQKINRLSARFSGVGADVPSLRVAGLSGNYVYEDQKSHIQFDSHDGLLSLPNVFRGETNWHQLLLQADWQHGEDAQLSINQLWCDCVDFKLAASVSIQFADTPYFQLNSHITNADMTQLKKYWPHHIWKPKAIVWLDQGLLAGTVSQARVSASGEIKANTFKNGSASMQAQTEVIDARISFNPDWPVVEDLKASVDITEDRIEVLIDQARTHDIGIEPSRVNIPDLRDVIIEADIKALSQDNALLDYLSESPIANNLKLQEDIILAGQQRVELSLQIPIKDGPQPLIEPQGQIQLIDGQLIWQDLMLEQMNGVVLLDGFTLKPQQLQALLANRETVINGVINTRNQDTEKINIKLQGDYSILDWFAFDMVPSPMTGVSTWQINLRDKGDAVELEASTDLVGVALNLPAPLNKSADTAKNLAVSCEIPCDQGTVLINYDQQVVAELSANQKQFTVKNINFGLTEANNPAPIKGQIKQLDLDQWLALANNWQPSGETTGQQALLATDIQIDELIFMSRKWSDVKLSINDKVDGVFISIDSETVKGQLLVANDIQNRGIKAEFEYLNWQTADIETFNESSADDSIPDIHLWVEQFSFADVPLGRLRMELRNVADGIKVEQLSIKSPLIELNANGEWLRTESGIGTSRFNMVIISERIADFLHQMDFNAPISNAQTLIEMDVYWPGLPAAFDVAALSGDLRIAIGQGEVVDQQPGFGRVLGLFNLTNLPRRLILDFRDVLSDGLHFEEMTGEFDLSEGVAHTDDFLIRASAAKIHMQGTVNFVEKSYNQHIIIRPQIGKTFPTLGAIAGGPVGAAAGFLVQGLLGKQLKSANEIKYHVTGPWSEPTIELLEQSNE